MGRMFILMGVAGCGKSSIGAAVADATGGIFMDGDAFHPPSNIEKMSKGHPLSDEDRWPWLKRIGETARTSAEQNDGLVFMGCSALKKAYRDHITASADEAVTFIFLKGSRELIAKRMAARTGHFMPTSLLDSQFETLEPPDETELAFTVDIGASLEEITAFIVEKIRN